MGKVDRLVDISMRINKLAKDMRYQDCIASIDSFLQVLE